MALRFPCTECGQDIEVRFLKAGETAMCMNCRARVVVPETASRAGPAPDGPASPPVAEGEGRAPVSPPAGPAGAREPAGRAGDGTRPAYVAAVAWLQLAGCGLGLVAATVGLSNPGLMEILGRNRIPVPVQIAFSYVGLCLTAGLAVGILQGQRWARRLYLVWCILWFSFTTTAWVLAALNIPMVVVFAVFVFLLYRPRANAFFDRRPSGSNP